jgi:hypothetical protein
MNYKNIDRDHEFYLENRDLLKKKYDGRYIVIVDGELIGDYGNKGSALEECRKHGDSFLVGIGRCDGASSFSIGGSSIFR